VKFLDQAWICKLPRENYTVTQPYWIDFMMRSKSCLDYSYWEQAAFAGKMLGWNSHGSSGSLSETYLRKAIVTSGLIDSCKLECHGELSFAPNTPRIVKSSSSQPFILEQHINELVVLTTDEGAYGFCFDCDYYLTIVHAQLGKFDKVITASTLASILEMCNKNVCKLLSYFPELTMKKLVMVINCTNEARATTTHEFTRTKGKKSGKVKYGVEFIDCKQLCEIAPLVARLKSQHDTMALDKKHK